MDVRLTDTSSIAAKRLELDKTRPVAKKEHNLVDERYSTTHIDSEAEEEEYQEEPDEEDSESESSESEEFDAEDSQSEPPAGYGGYHELDVRV